MDHKKPLEDRDSSLLLFNEKKKKKGSHQNRQVSHQCAIKPPESGRGEGPNELSGPKYIGIHRETDGKTALAIQTYIERERERERERDL